MTIQRSRPSQSGTREGGFTLVEILVSFTVLSLLLTLIFSMVSSVGTIWRRQDRGGDAFREGRAALEIITSDLRSMVGHSGHRVVCIYDSSSRDPWPQTAAPHTLADSIAFLTALPDQSQPGDALSDICAVGYFVAFAKTSRSTIEPRTYNLYRYLKNSDSVFAAMRNDHELPFTEAFGEPHPDLRDVELVARNVVQFRAVAWSVVAEGPEHLPRLEQFKSSESSQRPDFIELTLNVADDHEARKWGDSRSAWEAAALSPSRKHAARSFTCRVSLPSQVTAGDSEDVPRAIE